MVIKMNISYDHYKVFYYVAKYKNITLAAEHLFSNQPNVTRAIKALESELGCTLFTRSNRGVKLTPEGERLYRRVEVAIEQLMLGEEEITNEQTMQSGIVTVAVTETALHCCLLPLLKKFHEQYPKIKLRITNNNTPEALAVLRNKAADIAVVTLSETTGIPKELVCTPIKNVEETAVISEDTDFPDNDKISVARLTEYPIISLGRHTGTFALYDEWFHSLGLPSFSPDVEAATAGQIIPLVKSGLGIGFIPAEFLCGADGIKVIELEERLPYQRIFLAKRKDHSESVTAKKLERMILDAYT